MLMRVLYLLALLFSVFVPFNNIITIVRATSAQSHTHIINIKITTKSILGNAF